MTPPYVIATTQASARSLAVVRQRMAIRDLKSRFQALLGKVYASGLKLDGQNVFVYRQAGGDQFDIEFGVGVSAPFEKRGDVECVMTPAGEAVFTTHWGDYGLMRPAHDALQAWMLSNKRKFSGTSWEVYGHWSDDPAKLRTDIYYLLVGS